MDDLSKALAGRPVEKFNVDGIDAASRDEILTGISGMSDLTYTYVSAYDNLEANHCHATKGEALRGFCEVLGIPQQAVMAFGDSSNDVRMLRWAVGPLLWAMPRRRLVRPRVVAREPTHRAAWRRRWRPIFFHRAWLGRSGRA